MKKVTFIVLAALLAFTAGEWAGPVAQVACAAPHGVHTGVGGRGGDTWRGGGGGWHGGGGWRGGGGGWHRGHGGSRFDLWFGPAWGWDPFFYPYSYYPYYYNQPPVVIEQPQQYILPEPQTQGSQDSGYWYYCQDAKGYYPYVKRCPGGWLKVVPTPAPEE